MSEKISKSQKRLLDAASQPPRKFSILEDNNSRQCEFCINYYDEYVQLHPKPLITPTCQIQVTKVKKLLRCARRNAFESAQGLDSFPACPSCCLCIECKSRIVEYQTTDSMIIAESDRDEVNGFEDNIGGDDYENYSGNSASEDKIKTEADYFREIFSPLTGTALQRVYCIEKSEYL